MLGHHVTEIISTEQAPKMVAFFANAMSSLPISGILFVVHSDIKFHLQVTIVEMRNPITHEKKTGKKYTDFEVRLKV